MEPVVRVRLVNIDTVQSCVSPSLYKPAQSPFFDNQPDISPQVRIYGTTDHGEHCCLYIHGALPYVYIEYTGPIDPVSVHKYIARLASALNHALGAFFRNAQYIPYIVLTKGIPFYGFHVGYRFFLKIYSSDPKYMAKLVSILQSGAIDGQKFCVYEAHLPFLLQFLIDFNLYGCGWIDLGTIQLRSIASVPSRLLHKQYVFETDYPKASHSSIEIDVHASSILNRYRVDGRKLHHDFSEYFDSPDLSGEKLVHGVFELWEDERRRRSQVYESGPEEIRDSTNTQRVFSKDSGPEWSTYETFRKMVKEMASFDKRNNDNHIPSFKTFVKRTPGEDAIRTTFEQTDAIFPSRIERDESENYIYGLHMLHKKSGKFVDSTDNGTTVFNMEMLQKFEHQHRITSRHIQNPAEEINEDTSEEDDIEDNNDDDDIEVLDSNSTPLDDVVDLLEDFESSISDKDDVIMMDSDAMLEQPPSPSPHATMNIIVEDSSFSSSQKTSAKQFNRLSQQSSISLDSNGFPRMPTPNQRHSAPLSAYSLTPTEIQSQSQYQKSQQAAVLSPKIEFEDISISLSTSTLPNKTSQSHTTSEQSITREKIPWRRYGVSPPSSRYLLSTLELSGVNGRPQRQYRDPYFSNSKDVPTRPREYGGRSFRLKGDGLQFIKEFSHWSVQSGYNDDIFGTRKPRAKIWEYALPVLSQAEAKKWLMDNPVSNHGITKQKTYVRSQITGPTQANRPKLSGPKSYRKRASQSGEISLLCMELHANTRETLLPDPEHDAIVALCYSFESASPGVADGDKEVGAAEIYSGVLVVVDDNQFDPKKLGLPSDVDIYSMRDELDLINTFIDVVRDWDPDIVAGFEIQNDSWGYLLERGKAYEYDLVPEFGRAKDQSTGKYGNKTSDRWGFRKTSTIKFTGRHVIPIWRVVKREVSILQYNLQNVAYHVLRKVVPRYSHAQMTTWYNDSVPEHTARVLMFILDWVKMNVQILDQVDFITRTAEFARVFGVDFASILSRGSQFKVESVMARIAKPESFLLLSPSREDVGKQNAAECLPLILEPQSAFYKGPLLVLDFQSLYPSCIIAYNYCYSTCLGRVRPFKGTQKLGVTSLDSPEGLLSMLEEHINISPNGIMFVKSNVRKSLLSKMLSEILDTRSMVKESMGRWKDNKALYKMLVARQLGLKFIANVTYGYTSASFSGRMPCVEIADAIVQTGRETLEKAKRTIEGNASWGARVVYGDTDSLFVYLPGKTKERAFDIGNEIANVITSQNPAPIRLKFEKVYLPCVLMAKKRYVGYKYEHLSQKDGEFDAKGIETVRRDGFPALQKMVETSLKILFRSQDLSEMKEYLHSQWSKILEGDVSIQDFIYAKAVKLGTYSVNGKNRPPGVVVAERMMTEDKRAEPQYGDRVAYVIPYCGEGSKQSERALRPEEFLSNRRNMLDAEHYIDATCRAIGRILDLVGVDIWTWKRELGKRRGKPHVARMGRDDRAKLRIDEHFKIERCQVCGGNSRKEICSLCDKKKSETIFAAYTELQKAETKMRDLQVACASCAGHYAAEKVECVSTQCPLYYSRIRAAIDVEDSCSTVETIKRRW